MHSKRLFKIVDYFISDRKQLSEDEFYLKRLLILSVFILVFTSTAGLVLQSLGLFQTESNIFMLSFSLLALLSLRFNKKVIIPVIVVFTCSIFTLITNINSTGSIYSYNIKWFTLLMILFSFVSIRGLALFVLAFTVYLSYCFFNNPIGSNFEYADHLVSDIYIDSILYFLFSYFIIIITYNYLKKKNERLEQSKLLIEEKTHQLMQSNKELERFAHIASHDLKSPLRNIISFIMLLEKDMGDSKTAKQIEYLDIIKNGSKKLNTIITDVLAFSMTSNSEEKIERINPNRVIDEVKAMIYNEIEKHNVIIRIDDELPNIFAKRNLTFLTFKNLIENAIKYNDSPQPSVEISYISEGIYDVINFRDNGIGIEEKFHITIFEMFSRLHGESEYEGTGLGLSFCKKIMDDIGGKIKIVSHDSGGTTFSLKFRKNPETDYD